MSSSAKSPLASSPDAPTTAREPDKAGGEEVFSSDGLGDAGVHQSPAVVIRPPPLAPRAGAPTSEDDPDAQFALVDEDGFDVFQALEALGVRPANEPTASERLCRIEAELRQLQWDAAEDQALLKRVASLQEKLRIQQQQLMTSSFDSTLEGTAYSDSAAAALTVPPSTPRSDVESLLVRLERAVGTMNHHDSNGRGLLERMQSLEESVDVVNEARLDAVTAKVKVIRQDLEAASKAKNKLQMGGSGIGGSGAGGPASDPKVIAELYDALQQVSPVQSLLPLLAQRLEALQGQHRQVATFSSRLAGLESTTRAIETTVRSAEASVAKLEASWESSIVPQLQANLKAIDERIAKLASATSKQ